jgi:hypothetical protein
MRVTLTIDDDVLAFAQALAERNGSSLGSAISELARRGFKEMGNVEVDDGIPFFHVASDARPVTNEDAKEALSDWP